MTQLPYALFTATFPLIGFAVLGIVQHWIVTPIMMVSIVVVLLAMKSFYKNQPVKVKYVSKNVIERH
jgi:hypothetical protein